MSYYYTLWHPENPVILEYYEKYFQKLKERFLSFEIPQSIQDEFNALEVQKQKDFLCKSDISCLIQDFIRHKREESLKKLIEECENFFSGKESACTYSLWGNIPGTNIKLTLHDNNHNNSLSSHPDHDSGNMVWWGEKSEQEWMEVYEKSLSLLRTVNKDFYDELNYIIQKIVPFNTSYGAHNSCSYKESVGVLYLWYTVDVDQPEICILEALIHESSHNKLNLIMQSDELTLNDKAERFYSPYRPDARHIYGVYLGVHAIVPTVHTMLRAVEEWFIKDISWHNKAVLYHLKNKIGMRVLRKYAKCTDLWYKILDELDEVMKICDKIIVRCPELKRLDLRDAQTLAKEHFLDVQKNYPHLQY